MRREAIEVGKRYTYHPDEHDHTQHFPCTVENFSKSGRVKIRIDGQPRARSVSCRAISDQLDMFNGEAKD